MISQIETSIDTALLCVEGAAEAYDRHTIKSPLASVLVTENDLFRQVNFEGTHNPLDWFTDAKIRLVEYPKGSGLYVHSGFNESMLSVRDDLMSYLRSLPPKPTMFGGHSKGAGESRELVLGLTEKERLDIGFWTSFTFGEPRSLSRRAAIAYDRQYRDITFRFIHEEDFVARIPWMLGRYRHAGRTVFLPSTGGYKLDPSPPFKLASDAYGLWKAWQARRTIGEAAGAIAVVSEALKDHFIDNYLSALHRISNVSALQSIIDNRKLATT